MSGLESILAVRNVNIIDIGALVVFLIFVVMGIKKGLIRMVFDLAGLFLTFYLADMSYPVVSAYLRSETELYGLFRDRIMASLDIQSVVNEYIALGEKAVFEHLHIPGFFVELLSNGNIPSAYESLDVSGLSGYICGFLANMAINGISFVIVFLAVLIAMRVVLSILNILSQLPIIRTFNRLGGGLIGVFTGALTVWITMLLFSVIFIGEEAVGGSLIFDSVIGNYLYSKGLLIIKIPNIF